jgi:hypothetical protein
MRAFACTVLLRAQVEAGEADEATLAQCLASARVLGDEASDAAARFLTWGIPRMTYNRWLFAAGLLVVATRFRPGSITDRILGEAAGWVLAEESEERKKFLPFNPADPPPSPFGLAYGHWKPLAAELLDNAAVIPTPEVRNDLELIGAILLEPC